jgi:hypothetical protein
MTSLHGRKALAFEAVRSIFGWSFGLTLLLVCTSAASGETLRERCRSLTKSGTRQAAIAACDQAVTMRGTAEDFWAAAEVRVARSEAPTPDDLIRADFMANAAARLAPHEPWGALARFDLARRWGDPDLLAKRLAELEQVAPNDPRTQAAAALVHPPSQLGRILGWTLVFLVCVVTLAHAQKRRLATALVILIALGGAAQAKEAVFPIDDANPEAGVPTQVQANERPLDFGYYLQDLNERAERAVKRGDTDAAVRYYRAMAKAVPDSKIPVEKLRVLLPPATPNRARVAAVRGVGIAGMLIGLVLMLRARRPRPA